MAGALIVAFRADVSALIPLYAVGVALLVATALFSSAMDVTGIVAAGTLAILGLFVIPYKRKQVKQSFKEKMEELITRHNRRIGQVFPQKLEQEFWRLNLERARRNINDFLWSGVLAYFIFYILIEYSRKRILLYSLLDH